MRMIGAPVIFWRALTRGDFMELISCWYLLFMHLFLTCSLSPVNVPSTTCLDLHSIAGAEPERKSTSRVQVSDQYPDLTYHIDYHVRALFCVRFLLHFHTSRASTGDFL